MSISLFAFEQFWIEKDGHVCKNENCILESKAFKIHMYVDAVSDLRVQRV